MLLAEARAPAGVTMARSQTTNYPAGLNREPDVVFADEAT